MNILELQDLEQVAGGWNWKGAVGGGVAAAGGFVGGPIGGAVGLGVGFIGGGLLGGRWTDNRSYGGASGSW